MEIASIGLLESISEGAALSSEVLEGRGILIEILGKSSSILAITIAVTVIAFITIILVELVSQRIG